jgi:hypothetical protein
MSQNSAIVGVFVAVRDALAFIAKVSNRTYVEINIIAYFILIPCSWLAILDWILGTSGILSVLFLIAWLCFLFIRRDFRNFSEWLFQKSVDFLLFFDRFGSNYILSSVLICVVIPVLVYCALFLVLCRGGAIG